MSIAIKVENLGKLYRLGAVGTGTLSHDLNRWWSKIRGKEDPFLKLTEVNNQKQKGSNDLVWALKNIDFEVKQGEVLGIIGKNGAGKSTLLKILSRTTTPTVGSFKVKGRIASLLEVGTGFHPELTGRENIFLNGAILGMTRAEIKRNFEEIVAFSGIERYIDTPVKRYSSGMYVRLAFAVAAHLEPEILIVDEVLAVGDVEFQDKCIGKMKNVSGEGRTVLFVSHNLDSIKYLCHRGIVLDKGSVILEGSVDTAIDSYLARNKKLIVPSDLLSRKDRIGTGVIKAKEFWIENSKGDKTTALNAGEPCQFNIRVVKLNQNYLQKIYLALIFKDNRGQRLFSLTSDMMKKKFEITNEGVFSFLLKKMPLSIGTYFIDLVIFSAGEKIDFIESAISFTVSTNDYYSTGIIQGPNIDLFFVDYQINEIQEKLN